MLIRFAVTNHLSLKTEQELSLVASPLKDTDTGLLTSPALTDERLIPSAVIYGPNAGGKSNVVSALGFMRDSILDSHNEWNPEGGVPRMPFMLDPPCVDEPSKFEADFILDDVHYTYGFEAGNSAFTAEWLDAYPEGRPRTVFTRTGQEFKFGPELKKETGRTRRASQAIPQIIAELTRPNSLFLSAAIQNNNRYLSRIGRFFRSWRFVSEHSVSGREASNRLFNDGIDQRVIEFLSRIDTGVTAYRKRKRKLSNELNRLVSTIETRASPHELTEIDRMRTSFELGHRAKGDKTVFLDLDLESAGTRRLLVLLSQVYHALDEGSLLIADELDASLHTQACEAILALFAQPNLNSKGAQLIVTTHDTNFLQNREILRRDQIWFTEKDREGATHLYPLTDIRTRQSDNLERGYMQGRYGAVPFTGRPSDLFAAE